MQLEEFLDKLDGARPSGNGYKARCPAHDDREASLGVTEADNGILLKCYAGCDTADVLSAMGLEFKDLFFGSATNYAEPEAVYSYVDENGTELFQAVRFPGKQFRQRHWRILEGLESSDETGVWEWNLEDVRRVVYRLPEVLYAVRHGQSIYICEGEKDVEALRALDKVATCNPMGAGKWKDEFAQWFHGAKVIIVADRDEPGRAHAETIKTSLQGIAQIIWVYQAKVGKDVSDHLAAGLTVEQLVPVRNRVRRGVLTARELADQALEDLELLESDVPGYHLADVIPLTFRQGRMYAIGGYTSDGKTSLALQGTRRLCTDGAHVTYFSLEMPERDLKNGLLAHKGIPLRVLEEPWRVKADATYAKLYAEGVEEIANWNLDIAFDSGMNAEKVVEIVRDRESDVVIIDHVHRFGWGFERRKLEEQVTLLTNLALEQNIMLIILCQLRRWQRGKDMDVYPRPTLQDFRETEMIGQDASMALAVWRQRDNAGLTFTGSTQVIVLKNRHTTGPGDQAGQIFFPHFDTERQMLVMKASADQTYPSEASSTLSREETW